MIKKAITKAEGIEKSIKKLEVVKANIIKKNIDVYYYDIYWCTYGYCRCFDSCKVCPMQDINEEYTGIDNRYCDIVYGTLTLADNKDWRNALKWINIILDKMNKDLSKWKIRTTKVQIKMDVTVNVDYNGCNIHLVNLTDKIDKVLRDNTTNFDIKNRNYDFKYEE